METISPSGALFKFLVSFLLLNIPTQASGSFLVFGPTAPVQTSVGGEAVLSCHLSPAQNAEDMKVIWLKSQDVVHHYQGREDHSEDQTPNFQGRTELLKDAITAGNVTLRIWNVKSSDAGQYKCLFSDSSHSAEAFMELKVIEAPTLFETYPVWWSVIGILALGQLSILFYYSWKTYQFRGTEDLDEWVQTDQVYLGLLTFLPLLPTLLFVAVDFHGKRKARGNTARRQPSENVPLGTRR
uniref:Ig-like domain-containing protein n=1 Tax=Vombatus ursinus TaxID=29139 RepID=A0A4X2M493_VOMUR